ncbi:MAG TPA: HEAT repeat domain-containing protein [Gemmata sp.]|jgi:HEAT repeat protein|nr:HEAT repeat domain-containing protein [Gemmata sp.]
MMRRFLVLAVLLFPSAIARADEADDALARQLTKVVRDPRQSIWSRVEATRMIAKLGARGSAAVPDLIGVLSRLRGTELEQLQEALIDTLGQIGSPSRLAMSTMARSAGRSIDIDQALKRSSDMILTSSDAQDIDALIRQLRSRDSSQRLRAVKALGNLGPAARYAVSNIMEALSDTDADVRRSAIASIRLIVPDAKPTEAIVRALAADLTDPDAGIRFLAVRALGRAGQLAAGASAAIDALRNDPDPDVRKAAVEALSRILGQ